jgi:preprotein translocase subunit Sec61beta
MDVAIPAIDPQSLLVVALLVVVVVVVSWLAFRRRDRGR